MTQNIFLVSSRFRYFRPGRASSEESFHRKRCWLARSSKGLNLDRDATALLGEILPCDMAQSASLPRIVAFAEEA
jgi:hypothetical protein